MLSGSATIADYETALRSVTYENLSNNPNPATRSVSFLVNDGDTNSITGSRDISILPVNDPPELSSVESTTAGFIENNVAITISSSISANDEDDGFIESAMLQITGNHLACLLYTSPSPRD